MTEVVGWVMGRNGKGHDEAVIEMHPDVAKQMEKMHNEDPKKWGKEMKSKREAGS